MRIEILLPEDHPHRDQEWTVLLPRVTARADDLLLARTLDEAHRVQARRVLQDPTVVPGALTWRDLIPAVAEVSLPPSYPLVVLAILLKELAVNDQYDVRAVVLP